MELVNQSVSQSVSYLFFFTYLQARRSPFGSSRRSTYALKDLVVKLTSIYVDRFLILKQLFTK